MGYILDISHHQPPNKINYDKLAKQVDLVIIRTQYGSLTIDKYYKTHHKEFQKRGVPTAAYAWVRGVNVKDMEVEATDFYNRTKDLNPTFWFLDVEEKSMADMRKGVSAYIKKLRQLGAKKVGVYIANHLYVSFNLNLAEADAVWIPSYGRNDGFISGSKKPGFPCDIWQFTSTGRLDGYNGNLDLNILNSNKTIDYFTGKETVIADTPKEEIKVPDKKEDLKKHWASKEIQKAIDKKIMTGYSDGTWKPDQSLTRAEFVTVLNTLGLLD